MIRYVLRCLLLLAVLGTGLGASLAMAQQEPSMSEIYATAQSGNLNQAQVMVQQVLVAHPNSAKAHFVAAELYSRQGNFGRARDALASAEKLAPGLPFAKPEAVQALRSQLNGGSGNRAVAVAGAASPAPASSSGGWVLPLLLTGGVIVLAYFIFRPRRPEVIVQAAPYNGLAGPQGFGGPAQPGYAPSPYGQPVYGPQGGGIGSNIMGGVATGLAVGAGVVAAEAIGRNLMGDHDRGHEYRNDNYGQNFAPAPGNQDMGGQNFGISDSGSWDDGGSGGGSDWDN
jgi:uncharacterized protein